MPQELHVLCCYSCKMFQVDIVKKSKKWQCKVCNEKQSLQRVYFQGTGKDCRAYVQRLNIMSHSEPETLMRVEENTDTPANYQKDYQSNSQLKKVKSKWTKYLDSSTQSIESDATNATTIQISEYSDADDTVVDSIVINKSHGENNWNSDESGIEHVSVKCGKVSNPSTDCHDKLNVQSQYSTINVGIEKDTFEAPIKSKSLFDDNEDIDFTLDF